MRLYLLLIFAAVLIAFCDGLLFLSMDGASLSTEVTAASVEKLKSGFRAISAPVAVLDLNALYPEKENRELLDPAAALPQTTRYPHAQIGALYRFAYSCLPKDARLEVEPEDPVLGKAWEWHRVRCGLAARLSPGFYESPPFLHPSGASYAYFHYVDLHTGRTLAEKAADHLRYFHATELRRLRPRIPLRAPFDVLADLDGDNLKALLGGAEFLLSEKYVLMRRPTSLELPIQPTYLLYARKDWDSYLRPHAVQAGEFRREGSCHLSDGAVCWNYSASHLHYLLNQSTLLSFLELTLLIGVVIWFLFRKISEQRLDQERRRFALQTLTHELRTPLASVSLSLEGLRQSFDELGDDAQEAFLRVCDGAQRLQRVVEASRQYLTSHSGHEFISLSPRPVPSLNDFVLGCLEPYDDRIRFVRLDADRAFACDTYWLQTCLRNLVENSLKHGRPPVAVRLAVEDDRLAISVTDQGDGPALNMSQMTEAFVKGKSSEGLGLGLSIVKNIVREMGGSFTYSAHPTTFTIKLRLP